VTKEGGKEGGREGEGEGGTFEDVAVFGGPVGELLESSVGGREGGREGGSER